MNNRRSSRMSLSTAARALRIAALAAAFGLYAALCSPGADPASDLESQGELILYNLDLEEEITRYPMAVGDGFSIGFIHSVNKSPVTDYYEIRDDGIYVVKTVYYGFGAGVQTELEGSERLEYGEDGSMIITGIDRRMDDLIYIVGTVSDHILTLLPQEPVQEQISEQTSEQAAEAQSQEQAAEPELPPEQEEDRGISLRTLCGRNAKVRFSYSS